MRDYTIEIRTQQLLRETHHIHVPSLDAARIETVLFFGELLKDHADKMLADEDWRIDVATEDGLILLMFQLVITKAPALCA